MIGRIRGTLEHVDEKNALVDVGGVGYLLFISSPTALEFSSRIGEEVVLYTYLSVREQALDLYGFITLRQREFFMLLLQVSGIGPKSALSILSVADIETLERAVHAGDATYLTQIGGIGKKNAEKIVLELKDKIQYLPSEGSEHSISSHNEVLEALRSLGYSLREARDALSHTETKKITTTHERLKAALRILGSK